MEDPSRQLAIEYDQLYVRARVLGLSDDELAILPSVKRLSRRKRSLLKILIALSVALGAVFAVGLAYGVQRLRTNPEEFRLLAERMGYPNDERCFLENYEFIADMMRPVVDCGICRNVTSVARVVGLSQKEFMKKYAFTGTPVVVTDAMSNWTARHHFSFEFFRKLYGKDSPNVRGESGEECQFFPYQTKFENLGQVFAMSEERRTGIQGKPWYIGWSNCDTHVANELRKHYSKPYFLPDDVESSKTDWVFMGSPGYGAHMHIDAVGRVSWQAQVLGEKVWTLVPPPECYYECPVGRHDVKLSTGDILVVDTNSWFHSTLVTSKDVSLTIGSEFE